MNKVAKGRTEMKNTKGICQAKSYIREGCHFSIIRVSLSIALVFVLSGCMQDNNNNFNYFIAGTAGGTVASMLGYVLNSKLGCERYESKKAACCCSR